MQRRMAVRWGFCFVPKVLGTWRFHGANYSVASVDSPEKLDQLIAVIQRTIATEPPGLFPQDYARLFERRLRFNAARQALRRRGKIRSSDEGLRVLFSMVRATRIDKIMLQAFHLLRPASTFLSLAWLTMRLRPFSLAWLGTETVHRWVSERVRS